MFLFRYGKLSEEKQDVYNKPRSWFSTPAGLCGEMADFRAGAGNVPNEPGTSCMPESEEMLKSTIDSLGVCPRDRGVN